MTNIIPYHRLISPHGRNKISARPEMLAREITLPFPVSPRNTHFGGGRTNWRRDHCLLGYGNAGKALPEAMADEPSAVVLGKQSAEC